MRFDIEMLRVNDIPTSTLLLDGVERAWETARRQDVDIYKVRVQLSKGFHELSVIGIPSQGATFLVPDENIVL